MKDWNAIDKAWREQVQQKSEEIPANLWSRLEERLEEKQNRRFPIYWAAAAMLLFAIGISWSWLPEEKGHSAVVVSAANVKEKTSFPALEKVKEKISPSLNSFERQRKSVAPESELVETASAIIPVEEKQAEEVVAIAPVLENKSESEEIVELRLDIDPVVEEARPVMVNRVRKKTLFGKIIGEIRQALDGEPINWQKLKEGNPSLENNIHTVANRYVKTEENLKRTLQLQ